MPGVRCLRNLLTGLSITLPTKDTWLQEDSPRTSLCPPHLLWGPRISPLPRLLCLPELIDDKGEAIREPHGSDAATGDGWGRLELNQGHLSAVALAWPEAHHYTQRLPSTFLPVLTSIETRQGDPTKGNKAWLLVVANSYLLNRINAM